ncbi:hypothetical protein CPC08DRAFT_767408 [Agrocybe pediades]|nr:hypothetical protein CPC08DRAFT_767408 [Agrocybe pediades]
MGRQRKYFTPEEKKLAHRAESKRYRDRNKETINKHRREMYHNTKDEKASATGKATNPPVGNTTYVPKSQLDSWLERVELIQKRFDRSIGHRHIDQYMDSICADFIRDEDISGMKEHIAMFEEYQDSLYNYQDGILNLDGISTAFARCDEVIKKVRVLLSYLEDVHMAALCEGYKFREMFEKGVFEYQKKVKQ